MDTFNSEPVVRYPHALGGSGISARSPASPLYLRGVTHGVSLCPRWDTKEQTKEPQHSELIEIFVFLHCPPDSFL